MLIPASALNRCEGSPWPCLLLPPLLYPQGVSLPLLHWSDFSFACPLLCIHQGCRMMQWDLGYLKAWPSCFQPESWQGRILCGSTYSSRSCLSRLAWGLRQARRQLPWPALNAFVCCLGGSVVLGCFCTGPRSRTACQGLLQSSDSRGCYENGTFRPLFCACPLAE